MGCGCRVFAFFLCKQKTAYEMRISDWSSDVCSSDLAGLEDELDEVSGGRAAWQKVLEAFWRDFKPKTAEVMKQKPSDITAELDKFLEPMLFPDKGDGSDPRACPLCNHGKLALRGGRFGAFIACSNYLEDRKSKRLNSS